MSLLGQITRGKESKPARIVLYGIEGIGKSSCAARAPSPIFIPTEDGQGEIDCEKLPLAKSFDTVLEALGELYTQSHPYRTVVIDTLDWLERLIWDVVCQDYGVKSIEKADGGYARGYTHALSHWRKLLEGLDALRNERGMGCVLVAHAKTERFEDPEAPAYDRYAPRIHKLASALVCEWSDAVLFATRRFRTQSEEAGFNRTRNIAIGIGKDGGEAILRTAGGPSCTAKNRFSLPAEMPLEWPAVVAAIAQHQKNEGGK